ncbi:MAG: hypothetical protein QXD10_10150, partial [Metallosphaera sp.]
EDDDWRKQVRKGIIFVLRSLTEGIFIGGRKSVGAGFIKLVQPKIRSYKADKGEWVAVSPITHLIISSVKQIKESGLIRNVKR